MPTTYEVELPASSTYGVRVAVFTRFTHPGFPVSGVLEIREQRRAGGKVYARRFAVQETSGSEGRVFKLTKPLSEQGVSGQDDFHHVSLDNRRWDSCTCKGFTNAGRCAHVQAVRLLTSVRGCLPVWVAPRKAVQPARV
jgi:hypothetical protein